MISNSFRRIALARGLLAPQGAQAEHGASARPAVAADPGPGAQAVRADKPAIGGECDQQA